MLLWALLIETANYVARVGAWITSHSPRASSALSGALLLAGRSKPFAHLSDFLARGERRGRGAGRRSYLGLVLLFGKFGRLRLPGLEFLDEIAVEANRLLAGVPDK